MARILMTTFGSYGDVYPYVGLALGLRARGHRPVLAMPEYYRDAVEAEGLEIHPVRPDVDLSDTGMAARLMDPRRGTDVLFREVIVPSLKETHADLSVAARGAGLVITHPAAPLGPVVADANGIPWASTALAPLSFFSAYDPMVPAPAPWLHSALSRSRFAARLFYSQADRVTARWTEPIRELRRSLGLPPGDNPVMAGQHSPHLVLGLFSPLLADPQPDWPDNVVVTGPILYNGPGGAADGRPLSPRALPPELEEFLAAGPPPLVFTLGSAAVTAAGSFYDVSARTLRSMGLRGVLLVGGHDRNRPEPHDDLLILDSAPHSALFPRAEAIVHQGGAGTLHQAMRARRPMLVVPHAHDQPDNARRVEALGGARVLYPHRYRPRTLERELRALFDDPGYARNARNVGRAMDGRDAVKTACDAIDALLERHPCPRPPGAAT